MNWINSKNPCLIPKSFLYQLHTHIYIYSQKIYLLLQLHWIVVLHGNNIKNLQVSISLPYPVQHNGKSSREYILEMMKNDPFIRVIRSRIKFATPDSPSWNLESWILTLAFASISAEAALAFRNNTKRAVRFKRRTMSWREQPECWMLHFIDCVVDGALLWLHLYTPKTTFGPLVLVLALSRLCSFYEVVYDASPSPNQPFNPRILILNKALSSSRETGVQPFPFDRD